MSTQLELDRISELIDKLARIKPASKDKTAAYQHKLLQLLLQEKTTRLMNEKLSAQLSQLSAERDQAAKKASEAEGRLDSEGRRFRSVEESLNQKLKMVTSQNQLTKMKWLDTQEQYQELEAETAQVKTKLNCILQQKKTLKEETATLNAALDQQRQEREELAATTLKLKKEYEATLNSLQQTQSALKSTQNQLKEKDQHFRQQQASNKSLTTEKEELLMKGQDLSALLEKNRLTILEQQSELRQLKQEYDLSKDALKSLERENTVLKKQFQEDLHHFQNQKETVAATLKKSEKEIKKLKEELKECQSREKELEEEVKEDLEKIKGLEKSLKKSKKENDELKQLLSTAEESSGNEVARLKKYETSAKSQRQRISQLEELIASKDEALLSLKNQLQAVEKIRFEVSMQLEKTSKQKQVLSDLNLELEERRVLMESQREKAVSVLVKEKDVLSRVNFKLIQLLEVKEQAIKAIIKSMQAGEVKVEIPPSVLGGDRQMQELLSASSRDKLLSPKERSKVLSEWLASRRC